MNEAHNPDYYHRVSTRLHYAPPTSHKPKTRLVCPGQTDRLDRIPLEVLYLIVDPDENSISSLPGEPRMRTQINYHAPDTGLSDDVSP